MCHLKIFNAEPFYGMYIDTVNIGNLSYTGHVWGLLTAERMAS